MAKDFDASTARLAAPVASKPEDFDPSSATLEGKSGIARRILGDGGTALAKGVVGWGEIAVGLSDLINPARALTGGAGVGTLLQDSLGYDPKATKAAIDTLRSPDQKLADQRVQDAKGFVGTAEAMLANPSTIATGIIESIPAMVGGGVIGRGARLLAPAISPAVAGGIGEGVAGAGSAMEQQRQESGGTAGARETVAALGSGVGTGAFGVLGGKLSSKNGVTDIDTVLAGGDLATGTGGALGTLKSIGKGAAIEGLLQEMPQSAQEQVWSNFGQNKDLTEGVGEAAAQGLILGGALGGAVGGFSSRKPTAEEVGIDRNSGPLGRAAALGYDGDPAHPLALGYDGDPAHPLALGYDAPAAALTDQRPGGFAVDSEGNAQYTRMPQAPVTFDENGTVLTGGAGMDQQAPTKTVQPYQPPALTDQRPTGFAVDSAGNAIEQRYTPVTPAPDLGGGAGMDQPAPTRPQALMDAVESGIRSAIAAGQEIDARSMADRLGSTVARVRKMQEQVEHEVWSLAAPFKTRPAAMRAIKDMADPSQFEAVKGGERGVWRVQRVSPQPEVNQNATPGQVTLDQTKPVLQNRDRTTPASIAQMRSIAAAPDYGRLGFSRDFANGSPVVEPGAQIPVERLGRTDYAVTGAGRRIPMQYAVVEADQLLASNTVDGSPVAEYEAGQDGRSRVIAGNGRVAGLSAAWQSGTAKDYADAMAQDAALHGIDPQVIAGMSKPVLVRVMPQEEVTPNIGDESNTTGTAALSGSEQAKTDARRLDLQGLQFSEDGEITPEAVRQFVRSMPQAEQSGLMDGGQPSRQAFDRLSAAVFAQAYQHDALTRLQAQATDPEVRNVLSAMLRAAPAMSRLEGAGDLDLRPLAAEAAEVALNARRAGVPLAEYMRQADVNRAPEVQPILEMLAGNIRSAKRMGEALVNLANAAYAESSKPAADMFGDVPKRSRAQVLNEELSNDTEGAQAAGQQARAGLDAQSDAGQASNAAGSADPEPTQSRPSNQASQELELQSYSESDLAQREADQQRTTQEREQQEREAAQREQADKERNTFTLTGSDRTADVAAAAGQSDLLAPQNGEQNRKATQYTLPEGRVADEWAGSLADEFKPTARQKLVMDAVEAEIDAGTKYNREIRDNVAKRLDVPDDLLSINTTNVEGGDFGYDVYLAQKAVEARREARADSRSLAALNLSPGRAVGAILLGSKRINDSIVQRIDSPRVIQMTGKEGRTNVSFTVSATTLERAIDRAVEKGFRPASPVKTQKTLPAAVDVASASSQAQGESEPEAPNGFTWINGKGRISHKWGLQKDGEQGAYWNFHDTKAEAIAELDQRLAIERDAAASKATQEQSEKALAERLKAGEQATDADLALLGLKDSARFDYLSPVVQRLFGISKAKVRAAMGDALYQRTSDMGTKTTWGHTKKALANAAAFKNAVTPAQQPAISPDPEPAASVRLDDFGEKLEGGRKGIKHSLSTVLSDADYVGLPLSKIWPASEIAAIESIPEAALAQVLRDEIPAKPRVAYKVTRWVEKVKSVRELAARVLDGKMTAEELLQHMDKVRSLSELANRARVLQAIPRDAWSRITKVGVYPDAYSIGDSREKIPRPHVSIELDGRYKRIDGAKSLAEAIEPILEMVGATTTKEKKLKFSIYSMRSGGQAFIVKDGDKNKVHLADFPDVKAAREYLQNNYDDLVAAWEAVKERNNVRKEDVRSKLNRERHGTNHRGDKDVTTEQFAETFGFRGVEFGNWVSQGKGAKDRQGMLNEVYDAFLDLASILRVPPRAISLDGTLGLALGARGKGAAAAHYEPSNVVINLTKTKGAGSLAHEWFHALDNYFARKRGGETPIKAGALDAQSAYRDSNYMTHKPMAMMRMKKHPGTRLSMAEWRKRMKPEDKVGSYYHPDSWELDPTHPAGVRPEMEQAFQSLVDTLNASPMAERAASLDKSPGGYWSRTLEVAARAFESFTIDAMAKEGFSNDFLANVVPVENFPRSKDLYPYVTPSEMDTVRDAFADLFATMQTRETERGIELFERRKFYQNPDQFALDFGALDLRPGTTLAQRSTAQDAFDAVFLPYERDEGARMLGSALAKDFRKKGAVSLVGQTVKKPEDLAVLAQVYRDPRFETFRVFFTNNGEIVGQSGFTSRLPGMVSFPSDLDEQIASLKESFGADGYWMQHNHPSGNAEPSGADLSFSERIASAVPGYLGHVIINQNEFSNIVVPRSTGVARVGRFTKDFGDAAGYDLAKPRQAHDLLGAAMSSPVAAAEIAKGLQYREGYVTVIAAAPSLKVKAIFELPARRLQEGVKSAARLRRLGRELGTDHLFVVGKGLNYQDYGQLIDSGLIVDVISTERHDTARTHLDQRISSSNMGRRSVRSYEAREMTITYDVAEFSGQAWVAGMTADQRKSPAIASMAAAMWRSMRTASPFFQQWFKGSKLKNKNGAPVVFYHGTNAVFTEFQDKAGASTGYAASGLGIFLTADKGMADRYGQHTMPLYVRMTNPYVMGIEESSQFETVADARRHANKLRRQGYDGIYIRETKTAIAFDPKQIKSANINVGTFAEDEADIRYRLNDQPVQGGTDRKVLDDLVAKLSANWKNAPQINVVAKPADLPFNASERAAGVFHEGEVYLVASNLQSPAHAQFVLLHEVIGHYGLAGVLGSRLDAAMSRIYRDNPQVKAAADRWMKANRSTNKALATEEALSDFAASLPTLKGWDRFVVAVRNFLRRMGFDLAISDRDVADLLMSSRKWVEDRQHTTTRDQADKYSITPEQARKIQMETKLPDEPIFAEAVANTPSAQILNDGLQVDVVRFQKPEQIGDESVRTGVFYLPAGSANVKHYKGSKSNYGGSERFEGTTLLRRPLFVKGATGGKAPEAAYDQIKGKNAYEAMRDNILRSIPYSASQSAKIDRVGELLDRYGADSDLAYQIVANSTQGNQLAYAIAENIVAHAVRAAGYDSVLGYSKGKSGPFISEIFDVREITNPVMGMDGDLHPDFRYSASTQTDTPEFKRWFGDSKVVDADGNPLVVYHGTDADFNEFSIGDVGFHFGSVDSANQRLDDLRHGVSPERIMPVYLSIKNPLRLSDAGDWGNPDAVAERVGELMTNDDSFASAYERAADEGGDFRAIFERMGYDGIVYDNVGEGGGDSWIAFRPEQIKSATGNNGQFDPANPDIRYSASLENDLLAPLGESRMIGSETLLKDYGDVKAFESDFVTATHRSIRYVKYDASGRPIAALQFRTKGKRSKTGVIQNVFTVKSERRKGVASSLLRFAQQHYNIKHSDDLTTDGKAFAAADGIRYSFGDWYGNQRPFQIERRDFAKILRGKLADLKPAMLGALPLNYLRDFAKGPMVGAFNRYLNEKRRMDAYRNELHAEMDATAQRWLKLRWKNRKDVDALADLMHESTLAKVDPSKPFVSGLTAADLIGLKQAPGSDSYKAAMDKQREDNARRAEYDKLVPRYNALSTEAKAMFNEVRDVYAKQRKRLDDIIKENIKKSADYAMAKATRDYAREVREAREDLTGKELQDALEAAQRKLDKRTTAAQQGRVAKLAALRQQFEAGRVEGPYFPLKRFGDYFVTLKDKSGKLVSFSMFENHKDMESAAEHLAALHPNLTVTVGRQSNRQELEGAVDPVFLAEVQEIVSDLPNSFAVRQRIYQKYLETLPDFSMRKQFINRKGTPGFERDALRAFSSVMFHSAHQMARLKHSLEMNELVEQAEEMARSTDDQVDAMTLVNEMRRRHEWVMNPQGGSLAQTITSAAFVYQLGISPAAALVNTTQTFMLGVPVLGTHLGGQAKAMRELLRASRDFVLGAGHIEKKLSGDELAAFKEFNRMGVIEKTQAHDLAGVGETGVEYSAVRHKVMSVISWMFHNAERYNREVTVMAAYRMAREKGMSHAAAMETAADLTWQTHFDYSSGNRARYMQGDTAKVLFVFRQHNVNMLARLFIDARAALKGESSQVRKEARQRIAGTIGMFMTMAGVMGVPGVMAALALADLLDDDDDPWTAEDKFRMAIMETLGPDVGRVVLGGVPGALTDTALTNRIGMGNLWFMSPNREMEGQDAYYFWMEQALGAAPAMIGNTFNGMNMISQGHVYRGIETMMPKAIKDLMKSNRFAQEGVQTMRGDNLLDEVGAWGVIAQAMGFMPADLAERYEQNSALKNAEQHILRERRNILNRFAVAVRTGDDEARQRWLDESKKFSAKYPSLAITGKVLNQSLRARQQQSQRNEGGIVLDRRLESLRKELVGVADS